MHYCIQLANGLRLCFTDTPETKSWVDRLSAIMQLAPSVPGPESRRVTFIRSSLTDEIEPTRNLKPDLRSTLPGSGWKLRDHNLLQFWYHSDVTDVICNIGYKINDKLEILKMWQLTRFIYRWAQNSGGIPFHAGLIEKHGVGIVLAAQGGTGKSTCCNRIPPPWRALCDDEVLVVLDEHGCYMAHPFPTWSDYLLRRQEKTWNVQQYVPLRAVFFLEKSQHDQAIAMGQGQSAICINYSVMQNLDGSFSEMDREEYLPIKKRLFDNSCQLAKTVPVFKLRFSLTGQFWEEIEDVLKTSVHQTLVWKNA